MLTPAATSPNLRTRKEDLYIPILLVLAHAEHNNAGPLSSFQLRSALRPLFVLSKEDEARTPGDSMSRFERTAENTISHQDLVKQKWVRNMVDQETGRSLYALTLRGKAKLLDACLDLIESPDLSAAPRLTATERQAYEARIADMALLMINKMYAQTGKPITTGQLAAALRVTMPLSPVDLQPTAPSETPLARAVRNLISHNTLVRHRWVRRTKDGLVPNSRGKAHLLNRFLPLLPAPDFSQLPPAPTRRRALAR